MLTKVLEYRHSDRDLISATHVCHMWRSMFVSTPLLWTEVELGNPDRTTTYLERSKAAPLRVSTLDAAFDSEGFSADNVTWLGRTNSLRILADRDRIQSIVKELSLPAPALQSLEISGRTYSWGSGGFIHIPPTFLGQQAPFLRSLAFISVSPTQVSNLPLQNLTNLQWTDRTSVITVGEISTLLASVPLLETLKLSFVVRSTTGAEKVRCVTLSKLRNFFWANYGRPFSLMSFLIVPELRNSTIHVTSCPHTNLSTILPPHRDRFPQLAEPTALRYMCRSHSRSCHFTYAHGYLSIHQIPSGLTGHRPADRWLSSGTSISFRKIKHLTVEGLDGYPPSRDIPIEELESLESLELTGEVVRLLGMLRPNGRAGSEALSVPFPSLSELRLTLCGGNVPVEVLTEVLRNRREVGHGVKNLRIMGVYNGCSSEQTLELTKFVENVTKVH